MPQPIRPDESGPGLGVRIRSLHRAFGGRPAVEGIDLEVAPGSFVALIGPSGCGKTTILRMVGGLDQPDRGTIEFCDAAGSFALASGARAGVSLCFQEPRLLPWRSVRRNVELPLELAGVPAAGRTERAMEAIERVRLADASGRLPGQLSGGMKMRAAMARALVTKPRLLLLDEPFGALDEVTRFQLDEELQSLWAADRFTTLLVTHSIPEAVFLATRAIVLSPRPARIVRDEAIELEAHAQPARLTEPFNAHVRSLSSALHEAIREHAAAGVAR